MLGKIGVGGRAVGVREVEGLVHVVGMAGDECLASVQLAHRACQAPLLLERDVAGCRALAGF